MCECRLFRFDDKDPSASPCLGKRKEPRRDLVPSEYYGGLAIPLASRVSTTGPKLGSGESGNTIMAA